MAPENPASTAASTASGSSFYTAMRLLPKEPREAMYAIYAFCRAVDNIADDATRSRDVRRLELDAWRDDIAALYAGTASPRAGFLTRAIKSYGLREEDFLAIIDGMTMDVAEDICAPTLAELDLYCDRVASAVGRLSIKVFGMDEEPGLALAHHLGRALQLTNILRDIDEDAGLGRLYLPQEFLESASVATGDALRSVDSKQIDDACRAVAGVARRHYREAEKIFCGRPRGDLRPPRLMGAVYGSLLAEMESRGWLPPRSRPSIAKPKLLWFVLRYGLIS